MEKYDTSEEIYKPVIFPVASSIKPCKEYFSPFSNFASACLLSYYIREKVIKNESIICNNKSNKGIL